MKKFTPLIKGLITGIAMLVFTLVLFYAKLPANNGIQYIIYAIYAGGIIWTLIEYSKSPEFNGKFPQLFGQGFRCFIMVTLVMVAFTAVFSMMHPEFAEESAVYYKEELIKQKNTLNIDKEVETFKKQFTTRLVSSSIFGYLISGTIFTAVGAGLVLLRRNKPWI